MKVKEGELCIAYIRLAWTYSRGGASKALSKVTELNRPKPLDGKALPSQNAIDCKASSHQKASNHISSTSREALEREDLTRKRFLNRKTTHRKTSNRIISACLATALAILPCGSVSFADETKATKDHVIESYSNSDYSTNGISSISSDASMSFDIKTGPLVPFDLQNNTYHFPDLEIITDSSETRFQSITVQFTNGITDNDEIYFNSNHQRNNNQTLPDGFVRYVGNRTGMHSINYIKSDGATGAQWQKFLREYLMFYFADKESTRGVRITAKSNVTDNNYYYNRHNNHYYEFVAGTFPWSDALTYAEGKKYKGMKGYLATVTSREERDFIASLIKDYTWLGASCDTNFTKRTSAWAQNYRLNNSDVRTRWSDLDSYNENGVYHYYWVTGPEAGLKLSESNAAVVNPETNRIMFSDWDPSQPSNTGGNERYMEFAPNGIGWNDLPNVFYRSKYYLVEYGGMPDDETNASSDSDLTIDITMDPRGKAITTNLKSTQIQLGQDLEISENVNGGDVLTTVNGIEQPASIIRTFRKQDENGEWLDIPRSELNEKGEPKHAGRYQVTSSALYSDNDGQKEHFTPGTAIFEISPKKIDLLNTDKALITKQYDGNPSANASLLDIKDYLINGYNAELKAHEVATFDSPYAAQATKATLTDVELVGECAKDYRLVGLTSDGRLDVKGAITPRTLDGVTIAVTQPDEDFNGVWTSGKPLEGEGGLAFNVSPSNVKGLLDTDDLDTVLSDVNVVIKDREGKEIDKDNPAPGIYIATLAPGVNGGIQADGSVVSGGYSVKADPVTFVVAGEGANVVEGVDVRVKASNGSGSSSGADSPMLDAEGVYDLIASDPKSGLPEEYSPDTTDVLITLDGVLVDAIDATRHGAYEVIILSKADPSDPSSKDAVVFSELKVARPSSGGAGGGSGNPGTDPGNPGSGTSFAPIDENTDIRVDVGSSGAAGGTVGGDPYFEYDVDRPVSILDAIQVRPEGGDGWSQWMSGSNPNNPDGPNGPNGSGSPDDPNTPANPDGSGSGDGNGSGNGNVPGDGNGNENGSGSGDGTGSGNGNGAGNTTPRLPDNVQVTVTDECGSPVDPTNITEPGTYEVTVSVKDPGTDGFIVIDTLTFHVVDASITDTDLIYKDVAKDFWGHGYIFDIGPAVINGAFNPSDVALGYMAGYAGTTNFGPHNSIIRGDAAIVIWRMAGYPDVEGDGDNNGQNASRPLSLANACHTGFSDCDASPGMYYNRAIRWCASNGIVEGYGDTGEFRPQNPITREEFASIIARYAAFKGKDTSPSADEGLSQYPDHESISAWALPNMEYVVSSGIMTGKGTDEGTADGTHGILDPQAHVTRAEVAKMAYIEQPGRL